MPADALRRFQERFRSILLERDAWICPGAPSRAEEDGGSCVLDHKKT